MSETKKIALEKSESSLAEMLFQDSVYHSLQKYLSKLDNNLMCNIYTLVMATIEEPLLRAVMELTRYNQSKTARLLGINRGTVREKLRRYKMLK